MKAQKRSNSHEIYEKPSCWRKYSLVAKDWLRMAQGVQIQWESSWTLPVGGPDQILGRPREEAKSWQ